MRHIAASFHKNAIFGPIPLGKFSLVWITKAFNLEWLLNL